MSDDEIDHQIGESIADTVRSTLGDDMPEGLSFGVRMQGPPREMWNAYIEPRFKTGDLVVCKSFDDDCEEDIWAMKVVGLGTKADTYMVKQSGERDEVCYDGNDIKIAPDDAKWESYSSKTHFMNVPGLKISCPSNEKIRGMK